MRAEPTHEIVRRLIRKSPVISTRDVAAEARVSRQAAQKLLRSLVNSGELTIEGKARAARYRRVDDLTEGRGPTVDDSICDSGFRRAAQVGDFGSPYAAIPFAEASPEPSRLRLDVASAGSLFRLSARMLLCDAAADEVLLDFTGVMEVGDEFLEEIFVVWHKTHASVRLIPINVPPELADRIDRLTP
jgi:hypothetical protein